MANRKTASLAVQKAIYAMINDNLDYDIYDYVPESEEYPYICIEGDDSNSKDDTKDNYSRSIRMQLDIWDRAEGYESIKLIAEDIVALFGTDLVVSGFQVIDTDHDFRTTREGDLRRGILDLMIDLNQI